MADRESPPDNSNGKRPGSRIEFLRRQFEQTPADTNPSSGARRDPPPIKPKPWIAKSPLPIHQVSEPTGEVNTGVSDGSASAGHQVPSVEEVEEKEEITNEEVVLKTLSSVNASPLLKKRNGLSQNPDTIQDEVQEENQSEKSRSNGAVKGLLQRQEELGDLIDSGKGDSVNGDVPLDDDSSTQSSDIDFEEPINEGPSKFQAGSDKVLGNNHQEDETFLQWVKKMQDSNEWKENCPVSWNDVLNLDSLSVKELMKIGKAFNETIIERLKGPPEISTPEGTNKKRLKNPIYLFLGTEKTEDWKKIIQIACKSFHGVNRDLNAIGDLLERKQLDKKRMRQELKKCLEKFEDILNALGPDVLKLLALSEDTYKDLEMHKKLLDIETCPIVVAGQVSSGKTSLLNLFLGAGSRKEQEMSSQEGREKLFKLPVSVLACTGRVCEISYGNSRTAMIRHIQDGETEEINIEQLKEHVDMYGKDENYKAEEHINDIVQVGLPIPFLKGGITLVDTPGVGENPIDSEVVKNYVQSHDVFGFIFTIHTSAGGGVNEKFQQLLTELSTYRDANGHKKLDPESVVFVCNFWDQVPESDRKESRQRVLNVLEETGFMKDFDPDKQLFFMNSKGAFDTWNIGFISEDYDKLIGGMERFFEMGHKQKIMKSYYWLNAVVQRVMRSMKFIQVWAQDMGGDSKKQVFKELDHSLDRIEREYDMMVKGLRANIPKSAEFLAERLLKSLSVDRRPEFTITNEDVLYLESFKKSSDMQEYKIDEMVDTKISSFLSAWEAENSMIHNVKVKIVRSISKRMDKFDTRLDEFERQTLSAEKSKETPGSPFAKTPLKAGHMLGDIKMGSLDNTHLDIVFGRTYGDAIFKGSAIAKRASLAGNCVITNFAKRKRSFGNMTMRPIRQAVGGIYKMKDLKSYFEYRAKVIFDEMCEKKALKNTMNCYLEPVEYLINDVTGVAKSRIMQNRELISMINKRMIDAVGTEEKRCDFFNCSNQMIDMFNRLLQIGYETTVEEVTFHAGNLSIDYNSCQKTTTTLGVMVPGRVEDQSKKQLGAGTESRLVSVHLLKGYLNESEQLELVRHLRKLSMEALPKCLPVVLGLCEGGYGVVTDGHLVSLRQYFLSSSLDVSAYRHKVVNFVLYLTDTLMYLHSKDLVTAELSLDTIVLQYVSEDEKVGPLFTHVKEKGPVRLPDEESPAGNYIYLPYEVVQAKYTSKPTNPVDHWYTSAGDMYGLGVLLLELYHKDDLLKRLRSIPLSNWCRKPDPGHSIIKECLSKSSGDLPPEWIDVCRDCLSLQPKDRPTVKSFRERWESTIYPKYAMKKTDSSIG